MLWEGGLHMNLRQINELWNEYKEKYDLPKDVQISAVQYERNILRVFLTF